MRSKLDGGETAARRWISPASGGRSVELIRRFVVGVLVAALCSVIAAPAHALSMDPAGANLVAADHREMDDLVEERLLEMRGAGAEKLGPDRDPSPATLALVLAGTIASLAFLAVFLARELRPGFARPEETAASREARRHADELMASLVPKLVLLSEKEKIVAALVDGGAVGEEQRRRAGRLLREAAGLRFWDRFVAASSAVEEDPETALCHLCRLPPLLELALGKLNEAEGTLDGEGGVGGDGRAAPRSGLNESEGGAR